MMDTRQWRILRKLTRLSYIFGVAFLLSGLLLNMVNLPVQADQDDKIYWCHCEPSGGCQTLHLPPSALQNAGHMDASGNPLHAGDYAGQCVVETETPIVTESPTVTETPEETETPVATETPEETETPVVTETPIPVQPLQVDWECIQGDYTHIRWTVTNPNSFSVPYTWQLWSTVNGPTDAPSGTSTITIAELAISTMTITFDDGKTASSTTTVQDLAACLPPTILPLQITHACSTTTSGIDWSIYNPNAFQVTYKYQIDGQPEVAGQSINAGGTDLLHTTDGAHTITVSGTWGSASDSSTSGECVPPPPDPLTLVHACELDGDGITWTITNPNDIETLSFQWQLDGGVLSSSIVLAAGATYDVSSSGGAHTFAITGGWGNANDSSDSLECLIIPPLEELTLSYGCNEELHQIEWTLTNPNDEAVSFSYVLDTNPSVPVAIPVASNGSAEFLVFPADGLAHSVTVTYIDNSTPVELDPVTSAAQYCLYIPPVNLDLSYSCGNLTAISWTVTNQSNQIVGFNWFLDAPPQTTMMKKVVSGLAQAPDNYVEIGPFGTWTITSGTGSHTFEILWGDGLSERLTSPIGYCTEPTTNPTEPSETAVINVVVVGTPVAVVVSPPQEVLIPVTGLKFSDGWVFSLAKKLLINLSFIFFGMAFVLSSVSQYKGRKPEI
jgi:preprotein translocase subunit SecG